MICPNCKCEYIRGVTQCADCDVPLVNKLEPDAPNPLDGVRLVLFWSGTESSEHEEVKEALAKAEIPFVEQSGQGDFIVPLREPNLEIWISELDRERARKASLEAEGRAGLDDLTLEEIESLGLPESDQPDDGRGTTQPQELPEHWYEDEPVVEVWTGDTEQFADYLSACLREIGIVSHKDSEAGRWSLVVPSNLEARAKEVVREVVQAAPPE
jgi:hypothetical protein